MSEVQARYDVATPREMVIAVDPGQPWRCATGRHVLGAVVREGRVRRLHLQEGHVVTGHALIYCAECAQHKEWHAGAAALDEILSRRAFAGAVDREGPKG